MPEKILATINSATLRLMLARASRSVSVNRELLNRLNVFPVPDGDTGTNMSLTLKKMEAALAEPAESPRELARKAARNALMGARGNSGVILSQILRGLAEGLEDGAEVTPLQLAHSLTHAADCAYQAVIKPVEGTILTVAKDAGTAAMLNATEAGATIISVLEAAIGQGRITLARTPQMLEKLRQAGVVDAGGQGFVNFLEGMRAALADDAAAEPVAAIEVYPDLPPALDALPFLYCTEVNLLAPSDAIPKLRGALEIDADSLIVVGDDSLIHVHLHTNDPGMALSIAVKFGELSDVKVDNMRLQHNEKIREHLDETAEKVSIVAVVAGDGMKEIFAGLADAVRFVEGGQSMNPSTEELLRAVSASPANDVILLPNNPNIILAASKVQDLTRKKVHVIPTRSMPHGLAAMVEFDPAREAEETVRAMGRAAKAVSVAEITRAVRDAKIGDIAVKKADAIAILDEKLICSDSTLAVILDETVSRMAERGAELVTFYSGEGIADDEAEKTLGVLRKKFPDIEFEIHRGGQPHYLFLVSGE